MLLERLHKRNKKWRATTYAGHFWNEFSADVFLAVGFDQRGFYHRDGVRAFLKALNEACEETTPPGKFAWKAIYNDEPLAHEMNKLYGERRVLFGVPGHGPGSDTHIHLDLRPLNVQPGAATGFYLEDGRVIFSPPTPRPSAPLPPPLPVIVKGQ